MREEQRRDKEWELGGGADWGRGREGRDGEMRRSMGRIVINFVAGGACIRVMSCVLDDSHGVGMQRMIRSEDRNEKGNMNMEVAARELSMSRWMNECMDSSLATMR